MPKLAMVVDVETTGTVDPDVIQLSAIEVCPGLIPHPADSVVMLNGSFSSDKTFEPGALATHNILPEDVAKYGKYIGSDIYHSFQRVECVIGHNIDSDASAMKLGPDVKRICTLAIARRLWPSLPHRLAALTYGITPPENWPEIRDIARSAHDAYADVCLTLRVLGAIYKARPALTLQDTFDALYRFSERCRLPERMPIGKHGRRPECPEGERILDIPPGYLKWAFENMTSIDPSLRHAIYLALFYGQEALDFFDIDKDVEVPPIPDRYALASPA